MAYTNLAWQTTLRKLAALLGTQRGTPRSDVEAWAADFASDPAISKLPDEQISAVFAELKAFGDPLPGYAELRRRLLAGTGKSSPHGPSATPLQFTHWQRAIIAFKPRYRDLYGKALQLAKLATDPDRAVVIATESEALADALAGEYLLHGVLTGKFLDPREWPVAPIGGLAGRPLRLRLIGHERAKWLDSEWPANGKAPRPIGQGAAERPPVKGYEDFSSLAQAVGGARYSAQEVACA